jgi:hypothetical protein
MLAAHFSPIGYLGAEVRMAIESQPKYDAEEFARRGDEVYERIVAPHVAPGDAGKYVALDIETGAYEIDRDELAASDRLAARVPRAQVWLTRVGSSHARRYGPRRGQGPPDQ